MLYNDIIVFSFSKDEIRMEQKRYKVIFVDAEYRNGVELEKQCEYWLSTYNAYELDNVVSLSLSAAKKDIKGLLIFLRLRDDSESVSLFEEKN